MSKLDGYVSGNSWDKDKEKFVVKTLGTPDSGAILFSISVSGTDKNGNKEKGLRINGKVNIKSAEEGKRVFALINGNKLCEFEGFFVPNNYEKDGKTILGNQFLVTDSTTFVEMKQKPKKQEVDKPKVEDEDDDPWESKKKLNNIPDIDIDEDEIPF